MSFFHIVLGPMYSGKTSELIRLAERYRIAGKRVLVVKYAEDSRYVPEHDGSGSGSETTATMGTHNGRFLDAVAANTLQEIVDKGLLEDHDVICVDEVQFYPDSALVVTWADAGKTVVASGLSGNYLREQFSGMPHLIANADCIEHLTSICMQCKKDGASFSALRQDIQGGGGAEAEAAATKFIGGAETYLALCRSCYVGQIKLKQK